MQVQGYDFEAAARSGAVDWDALGKAYSTTGLQATEMDRAVQQVLRMQARRREGKMKVVLAYTSNLISCGLREVFSDMAKQGLIDAVVTTAGGVEEDLIKCLGPTVLGDFSLDGAGLRAKGLNRIANLLVPNDNYCKFEKWLMPILDAMRAEQDETGSAWTPSAMIARMGREAPDATSFYHSCHAAGVPVFCPSLSDGSIGDMLYFHAYDKPGLVVDSAGDLPAFADALTADEVGVICLGGGLPKHHTLMGARLAGRPVTSMVLINTGMQFDGSETGMTADDDRASLRYGEDCEVTRLHMEATIAFPIIMQRVFRK